MTTKTVKQWFNHLPPGTKKAAYAAVKKDKTADVNCKVDSLGAAIATFLWYLTPEGFYFWHDLMSWAREQEGDKNFKGKYTWKK